MVITHEMRVIEQICGRVAVLDRGSIAEMGPVRDVFANPKTRAARQLILTRQSEQLMDELYEGVGEHGL